MGFEKISVFVPSAPQRALELCNKAFYIFPCTPDRRSKQAAVKLEELFGAFLAMHGKGAQSRL
jgi:hypothetical protein